MSEPLSPPQVLPRQETAYALIKALFPAGEKFSAAEPKEVEALLLEITKQNAFILGLLSFQLSLFNFICLTFTGQWFTALTEKRRQALIQQWSEKTVRGLILRATALPYKLAYIQLSEVEEKLCLAKEKKNVAEPARWLQQMSSAADFDEDQELEADVVIVGTGAGGAAAAYEFASKGLAVVLIEEGQYYDRSHFTGNLFDVVPKLYRLEPTGTIGNHVVPVPIGKNVGGTTTINSGTAMRPPAATLKDWRDEGLTEFTEENLDPYFSEVERVICAQKADPKHVGQLGEIMRTGATEMGFKEMGPLTRNAEGCDGQGLCQFGCPTDAKKSTNVSYIPLALDAGAFLFTGFKATEIIKTGKSAEGIIAVGTGSEGKKVRLSIKASKTIIAMGTFYTPVFLKQNGVKNKWLGKNLSIHPAGVVTGLFKDKNFENTNKIPQGYGVGDWGKKGILFEGGTPPFMVHAVGSVKYGDEFVEEIEDYQQTAYFGFMIKDTTRGKVFQPSFLKFPILWYWINKKDRQQLILGMKTLASFYLKAGADEIYITGNGKIPPIKSMEDLEALFDGKKIDGKTSNGKKFSKKINIRDFLLTGYHPLGTAKIGSDKTKGVCDRDHKVFDWDNLYVMDGSAVPSALGANPQVTIMALASLASNKLAKSMQDEPEKQDEADAANAA